MDLETPSIMRTVTPSKTVTSKISEKINTLNESVKKTVSPGKTDGGVGIIKILLIAAIVLFLLYNIYLYFTEGTDVLGKYFGIGLTGSAKTTQTGIDTVANSAKDTVDVAQNVADSGLEKIAEGGEIIKKKSENQREKIRTDSPIENRTDVRKQIRNEKKQILPESSYEKKLPRGKKSGYCYLGTDRTFRSCVKIHEDDICMSKQIFPTKEICLNPNLRY